MKTLSKYFANFFIIAIFAAVSFGCFWTTNDAYKTVFECVIENNLCKIMLYDYAGNPVNNIEFKINSAKAGYEKHKIRKRNGQKTYRSYYIVSEGQKYNLTIEEYDKFITMQKTDNKSFILTHKNIDGIILGIIFALISFAILLFTILNIKSARVSD